MLQRLATFSKTVSIMGNHHAWSARPIVSVVHSVVGLRPRYLFDSYFLNESRENRAVPHRFGDVNLLRRLEVVRKFDLRLVCNPIIHSSSP